MKPQIYQINQRPLTYFNSIEEESAFEEDKNYLFELNQYACIHVIGENANQFLQGQLSCDVRKVTPNNIQQGALCNLKGRVLALVDVVFDKHHQLILPKDLAADTVASLNKTALLSRVKLEVDESLFLFGFFLQNQQGPCPFKMHIDTPPLDVISNQDVWGYHVGQGSYLFKAQNQNTLDGMKQQFSEHTKGSLGWHVLNLKQGRFEIYPETRGEFLPHRLGLQHSGHLSFDKGCYKGQEIIARTQYKGTLKHETRSFQINTDEALYSGQKIFAANANQEIGALVDYAPLANNLWLVCVILLLNRPTMGRFDGHVRSVPLS